jgi:hypothetical protein
LDASFVYKLRKAHACSIGRFAVATVSIVSVSWATAFAHAAAAVRRRAAEGCALAAASSQDGSQTWRVLAPRRPA